MYFRSLPLVFRLAVGAGLLAGAAPCAADPLVTTVRTITDVTDFSPTGVDLGKAGYWFPNFDAAAPAILVDVDQNVVDEMPDWLAFDYDPGSSTYSFGLNNPSTTYSTGGVGTYNTFTLPNGVSGLSGQLVDDMNTSGTQSNQIIPVLPFGDGSPTVALVSVILDNAPTSELTSPSRIRLTHTNADLSLGQNAQFDNLFTGASHNGVADVYQFFFENIEVGGFISVQLRSPGALPPDLADAALGGVLVDPVVPGDANLDGIVTGADYTIWADNFGTGSLWTQGDFNGDDMVTGADFTIWADHFGQSGASIASVPEPSAYLLGGVAALAAFTVRRRGPRRRFSGK